MGTAGGTGSLPSKPWDSQPEQPRSSAPIRACTDTHRGQPALSFSVGAPENQEESCWVGPLRPLQPLPARSATEPGAAGLTGSLMGQACTRACPCKHITSVCARTGALCSEAQLTEFTVLLASLTHLATAIRVATAIRGRSARYGHCPADQVSQKTPVTGHDHRQPQLRMGAGQACSRRGRQRCQGPLHIRPATYARVRGGPHTLRQRRQALRASPSLAYLSRRAGGTPSTVAPRC